MDLRERESGAADCIRLAQERGW